MGQRSGGSSRVSSRVGPKEMCSKLQPQFTHFRNVHGFISLENDHTYFCVYVCVCATEKIKGSEDNLLGSALSYHAGFGD